MNGEERGHAVGELPPTVLQRDLDRYREKARSRRRELLSVVAQLRETRRRYLALQERYARLVTVSNSLLDFPDKSLIPWTEWEDFRSAVNGVREARSHG